MLLNKMTVAHFTLDQKFPRFYGYSFNRDHIWTLSCSSWIWLSSLPCEYQRFPWRKLPECKFDHSPPSCEQAKNKWSSASNPLIRLHGVNRDALNFILIKVFTLWTQFERILLPIYNSSLTAPCLTFEIICWFPRWVSQVTFPYLIILKLETTKTLTLVCPSPSPEACGSSGRLGFKIQDPKIANEHTNVWPGAARNWDYPILK